MRGENFKIQPQFQSIFPFYWRSRQDLPFRRYFRTNLQATAAWALLHRLDREPRGRPLPWPCRTRVGLHHCRPLHMAWDLHARDRWCWGKAWRVWKRPRSQTSMRAWSIHGTAGFGSLPLLKSCGTWGLGVYHCSKAAGPGVWEQHWLLSVLRKRQQPYNISKKNDAI